jgi:hypothetical protein
MDFDLNLGGIDLSNPPEYNCAIMQLYPDKKIYRNASIKRHGKQTIQEKTSKKYK